MGKLHRIRKAWNRLPDEEKRRLGEFAFSASFRRGKPVLRQWGSSYRRYVKMLYEEWYKESGVPDRPERQRMKYRRNTHITFAHWPGNE